MPESWVERMPEPDPTGDRESAADQAVNQAVEPVVDLSAEPGRDVLPESLAALMNEPPPDPYPEPVLPDLLDDRARLLAERLATDLAGVSWPAPEQIRARGRRRARRTAVAVPVAVVLVFATIWGVVGALPRGATGPESVAGRADPEAAVPATASSAPDGTVPGRSSGGVTSRDPAWIPAIALLQPADLGLNFRIDEDHSWQPGSYPDWPFRLAQSCPAYAGLRLTGYQDHRYSRGRTVGGDTEDGRWQSLAQQVTRYADGAAARTVVDDVRRVVEACRTYDAPPTVSTLYATPPPPATPTAPASPADPTAPASPGKPTAPAFPPGSTRSVPPGATTGPAATGANATRHAWRVLGDGFAGNQSLLVRQEVSAPTGPVGTGPASGTVTLYAVVRVGDLVAVLESYDYDDARMRQLADRAAAWLCPFANPRC
ncbi:hypothetical protein OG792_29610 [Micromonospora sp. NBC_01699]|uniref:hypothetical protein n=1 Tax=Micromonospora sp. NBC_01699 TaxID=2975984 RepID=UPI002E2AF304|nr:hypothetical protein [Micromonospora sp. NBC_01699]